MNAYHPGIVKTGLNRNAPAPVRLMSGLLNLFAGSSAEKACEGLAMLATSEEFAETSKKLIRDEKLITAPFIDDKDLQDRLWKVSCGMVGLPDL